MRRIEVDFNTLTSEPVDLVKIAEVGSDAERELLPLRDGERVTLWEPGLEAEATLVLHGGDYWMARPDGATWHDLPLSPEEEAQLEPIPEMKKNESILLEPKYSESLHSHQEICSDGQ